MYSWRVFCFVTCWFDPPFYTALLSVFIFCSVIFHQIQLHGACHSVVRRIFYFCFLFFPAAFGSLAVYTLLCCTVFFCFGIVYQIQLRHFPLTGHRSVTVDGVDVEASQGVPPQKGTGILLVRVGNHDCCVGFRAASRPGRYFYRSSPLGCRVADCVLLVSYGFVTANLFFNILKIYCCTGGGCYALRYHSFLFGSNAAAPVRIDIRFKKNDFYQNPHCVQLRGGWRGDAGAERNRR